MVCIQSTADKQWIVPKCEPHFHSIRSFSAFTVSNSHLFFINYISSAFVVSSWKREKKVSIISLLDCGMQQLLCFANIQSYLRISDQFLSGFKNTFLYCCAHLPQICEFMLLFSAHLLWPYPSSTWISFSSLKSSQGQCNYPRGFPAWPCLSNPTLFLSF